MEKREFEILVYKTEKEIKSKKGDLFNDLWLYHFKPTPSTPFPSQSKEIFKTYWNSSYDLLERISLENGFEYKRPDIDIDKKLEEFDEKSKISVEKFVDFLRSEDEIVNKI